MKAWFHNRRIRHQDLGSSSAPQREPFKPEGLSLDTSQDSAIAGRGSHVWLAEPAMASRLSIERYLSAPFSDEAASAPAINAAIRGQGSRDWIESPTTLYQSRATSVDVHSDGRPTFFTTGSITETVDTSGSINSRSRLHHPTETNETTDFPESRKLPVDPAECLSHRRPTTGGVVGPVGMTREWVETVERSLPSYPSRDVTMNSAKTKEDISRIQTKARELEHLMQQFEHEQHVQYHNVSQVNDGSAEARMAANPKLAWILGGEDPSVRSIARPTTMFNTTADIPDSPSSVGRYHDTSRGMTPRKSKSSGALDEEAQTTDRFALSNPADIAERQPSGQSSFYCTFCEKRFHNRAVWLRHERTIHMPEEMWVCCPRTGTFPQRCPFCDKSHPSPAHLADHNYLSCQKKPLPERSFSRKDHFLQHVTRIHKVSPEQKPARLTELEHAWRRPLPLDLGHQALHCGFCGLNFATYQDRTTHVGRHFADGADMMSWWKDRVSHDVKSPENDTSFHHSLPHQCIYCERTFKNLALAQKLHSTCIMWSCSFLPSLRYTIYPNGSHRQPDALCCYCNVPLRRSADGKVNGVLLEQHMAQHNYRACNQTLYFSGQQFRQHLQDTHRPLHDSTLFAGWTLLLKSSRSEISSAFQPIDRTFIGRPSMTGKVITNDGKDKKKEKTKQIDDQDESQDFQSLPTSFMDLTESSQRTEPNKLRRKQSSVTIPKQSGETTRPSLQLFARSPATDFAIDTAISPEPSRPMPEKCTLSPTADGAPMCPAFYRKRFDASIRNRIYMTADNELVPEDSQQMFRKLQGSVFGGLILHSSLVGAVPALMTNSIDVYALQ